MVGGAWRDAQDLGRLFSRQAGEEAQLDQLGAGGVLLGQALEAVVQGDQLLVRGPVGYVLDPETRQETDRLFALLLEALE